MSSKVTLTEYFQAVDRHLIKSKKEPKEGFRVRICGKLIDLRFPTVEMAQAGRCSLEGFLTEEAGAPDATLLYWYDRCDAYLPAGESAYSSVWQSRDATGSLQIGTDNHRLVGSDFVRRRFYYARPKPDEIDYSVYGHTLAGLFSRWASESDCMLLHAAAVGWRGKGVLVVGRSGSGKSTFSVSCLTAGLDFVSDDYTLISASGPLLAMPLYTSVAVNPDMYAKMPWLGDPSVEPSAAWCNGKYQFRLERQHLCPALEIHGIIMPRISGEDAPSIRSVPAGSAMTQMLHSSLKQLDRNRDTELMRTFAARMGGLPVYEMSMSTDLTKNPAFLRSFIEKEF